MYQLAFIYKNTLIYWHSVILTLSVLAGLLLFWWAYCRKTGELSAAALVSPIAFVLALVLARLAHWYFRPDAYDSFAAAMTDFSRTGYALIGAFAGCALAACLLRLLQVSRSLPEMLDCMCIGGSAAIALGRLSCFFSPDDRGSILSGFTGLPFAWPVVNATSGLAEYRLATFLFQAVAAGCVFLVLVILFRGSLKKKRRDGDITLVFLLLYCAAQVVLDSTRYDRLTLRVNGFLGVVQIFSALTLVLVLVILSARLRQNVLFLIPCWLVTILMLGCGGYMEYFVQRHGDRGILAYGIMSGCMGVIVLIGCWMLHKANRAAGTRKGRFQAVPAGSFRR